MKERSSCLLFLAGALAMSCSTKATSSTPSPADAGSVANGMVMGWTSSAALLTPRANHCSAIVGGYLVVIGGNYKPAGAMGFVDLDTVDVAAILPGGSLGAWKTAGKTPSPVNSCTATASGNTLLIVDGIFKTDTDGAQVWSATLDAAGTLAPWASLGPLPPTRRVLYSQAWVSKGTLFAMDSKLPADGDVVATLHASFDGKTLGAWAEDDWLPGFRGHPEFAATDSFVYTLGGYQTNDAGSETGDDVHGARIGADGTVSGTFATLPMPAKRGFGAAVAVDDYLVVAGGKDGILSGTGSTDVFSAKIGADGNLAAWTQQEPLPEGRTSLSMVVSGDYVYVTGGGFDGPGLDSVFVGTVRYR